MTRRTLLGTALIAPQLKPQQGGRTVYVAPDGSERGDGSSAHPWPSVEYALPRAGGGATVVLRPGFCRGIRVSREFPGTTLRAESKWKAVVIGSTEHGIFVEAVGVVVDGLEVTGSRIDGIKFAGDGGTVRNCWVHNNSAQGIAMHGRSGWTIERNLIEYNGQHPQLQHGIYADGDGATVRCNIIRHNSGYGVQLYPALRDGTVVNNLIYGHSSKGGIVLASPGGHHLVANNTIADNAYGIRLMGGVGQVIANNIIVSAGSPVSREEQAGEPLLAANLTDGPKFVDRAHRVYFLAPGSPAIGRGDQDRAPAFDFWGRKRDEAAPVDIGAFPFLPALASEAFRAMWHNGWAYRFSSTDPRMDMPDLWVAPR